MRTKMQNDIYTITLSGLNWSSWVITFNGKVLVNRDGYTRYFSSRASARKAITRHRREQQR